MEEVKETLIMEGDDEKGNTKQATRGNSLDRAAEAAIPQLQPLLKQLTAMTHI